MVWSGCSPLAVGLQPPFPHSCGCTAVLQGFAPKNFMQAGELSLFTKQNSTAANKSDDTLKSIDHCKLIARPFVTRNEARLFVQFSV